MADIRKRTGKKGTTYQVRYPSKATKSGYAFKTFDTLKEARAFLHDSSSWSTHHRSHVSTVPAAADLWLDICEKIGRDGRETVEPETLKEYRRRARIMKEYKWTEVLQALKPSDVVQFRNWLLENKTRDLARRTLSSFHSVIIEMKHQGHINHDPASGITIKSGGRYEDDETEIEIPSDEEMRAMYAAADRMGKKNDFMAQCWARYRPMIYLAGFTGMRPSEIRGLPWSSVRGDRIVVTQRADKTGIIGPVKSRAAKRTIFLPEMVSQMLAEWHDFGEGTSCSLVFPTANRKPQSPVAFRSGAWLPLMREAGLVDMKIVGGKKKEVARYTPYALRHYFASKLIEKQRDLKFIQTVMGHSRIEVTLNVYGHLMKDRDEENRAAAEDLVTDVLASSCGKFVASPLYPAETM